MNILHSAVVAIASINSIYMGVWRLSCVVYATLLVMLSSVYRSHDDGYPSHGCLPCVGNMALLFYCYRTQVVENTTTRQPRRRAVVVAVRLSRFGSFRCE